MSWVINKNAKFLLYFSLCLFLGSCFSIPKQKNNLQPVNQSTTRSDALAQARQVEMLRYKPHLQKVALKGQKDERHVWNFFNPKHNLRSQIDNSGWKLFSEKSNIDVATHKDKDWTWKYSFLSLEPNKEVNLNGDKKIILEGDTVYIEHSKNIKEFYKNTSLGIEQGFEIASRPSSLNDSELVLRGTVETDLSIHASSKKHIAFSKNNAVMLNYSGLKVIDADGKELKSWLSNKKMGETIALNIHIDDSGAKYPILVDPLATSPSWITESDQAHEYKGYGNSVASAGDVNGDGYTDVIVGDYAYTNGGGEPNGRVFLYYGSSTGLSATADWTAIGGAAVSAGDVNSDGYADVMIAGSSNNGHTNEGRVSVHHGSASGLSNTANWTVEGNETDAYLGIMSTAGDVNGDGFSDVVIGCHYCDTYIPSFSTVYDAGKAFVYYGSANGLSTSPAWSVSGTLSQKHYGTSLTAGDINRDGYSDLMVSNWGSVFIYHGSANGLPTTENKKISGGSNYFGGSISGQGDFNGDGYSDLLVGDYEGGFGGAGSAYAYHGTSSGLNSYYDPSWKVSENQNFAYFGISVASSGDVNGDGYSDAIVGAYSLTNGQEDEGKAFLYTGSANGLTTTADWTDEGDQADSSFGISVALAADVNGDSFSDALVGASAYDNDQVNEGRAFAYHGNEANGFTINPRQLRLDNKIIQPLTRTNALSFKIRAQAKELVEEDAQARIIWEVKPFGTAFNGTSLGTGSWNDISNTPIDITETVSGLQNRTSYHWRMRLQYSPGMNYSSWFYPGGNGGAKDFFAFYNDGVVPTVTNVTSPSANGYYKQGQVIPIRVVFSEPVTVNITNGRPYLRLETGTTDRNASFAFGSGTSTLTFNYTVMAGDNNSDLGYVSTSSLATNGGTIKDLTFNNARLTLPSSTGSLKTNKDIRIDTRPPTLTISSTTTNPTSTSPIPISITFSENVTGFVASDLRVTNGQVSNFSGSGKSYSARITPTTSGAVTVKALANVAIDAARNANSVSNTFSRTYAP